MQASTGLSRRRVLGLLERLPAILTGQTRDAAGHMRRVLRAVGVEALNIIREEFLVKARGGTDATGVKWQPLSPTTIAYKRRHPGLQAKRTRAAKQGRARRPLLTAGQDKLWRGIFAGNVRRGVSKSEAAARAWVAVKARGGRTLLAEYGSLPVEIGRDTGRMFNSLAPGRSANVLRIGLGKVEVGTNVPYAIHFHKIRPLWPDDHVELPAVWQTRLDEVLEKALVEMLQKMLTR